MDARILLVGNGVDSNSLMNSVESFRCEGSFFTNGWSHLSTNCDVGSMMLLQLDTIGLMLIGILCIFSRNIVWMCENCLGVYRNHTKFV